MSESAAERGADSVVDDNLLELLHLLCSGDGSGILLCSTTAAAGEGDPPNSGLWDATKELDDTVAACQNGAMCVADCLAADHKAVGVREGLPCPCCDVKCCVALKGLHQSA